MMCGKLIELDNQINNICDNEIKWNDFVTFIPYLIKFYFERFRSFNFRRQNRVDKRTSCRINLVKLYVKLLHEVRIVSDSFEGNN